VEKFDVIIIGAGAAGMFCAAQAGQLGRRVLLLDNGKKSRSQNFDVGWRSLQLHQHAH
jgi:predicted flavoprotein YhiN